MWSKPKESLPKEDENDLSLTEDVPPLVKEDDIPIEEEIQGVDSQEDIPEGEDIKYGIQMEKRDETSSPLIEEKDFNLRKARVTRPNRKM